ncbi:Transglutaminase-like enzyme, putative cysteine protease [Dyadobacter soli]|uniref:Transglutaminase-like enzyme, putative cysteine protease n=1 Tax=Dyadobacter soli TaxID=659014 RepID=A0A1G7JBS8_9BACT|nr:transglutaminase family protein [Dyadobacter soli]SDF21929.1 Transglutaminase-like enzyme, putative cysteine protease [Dyadobacter soli]
MKMQGRSIFTYDVYAPTTVTTMLRPRRQEGQSIIQEGFKIEPPVPFSEYTDLYGNPCQRAILPVGRVTITTEVQAQVNPTKPIPDPAPAYMLVGDLPDDVMHYILPSRYCQSDLHEINMLALEIAGNLKPGYDQVEAIRTWIHNNVRYQYGMSNAATTAFDTARSRVGVCRDFTHLAIALCRNLCIPTRMTVGYLDKLKEMDLHAWFEVFIGGEWYTFDAVQEKTEGYRIEIAHGRDAADVAMVTQYGNAALQSLHVEAELLEPEQ